MDILSFYEGKKVFLTGHTGFKGSWLCHVLIKAGAEVTGYSLEPPTDPALFYLSGLSGRNDKGKIRSITGDIRDYDSLQKAVLEARPEIVIHLAAQPLVRESYRNPVDTYAANVMGTVHILEAVRQAGSVKSFLNVTTDKVYRNREWEWGYRENEELNGYDPYSNSKSCSELVTGSYVNSFLKDAGVAVSTARAGNVIGGGDFAKDRIVPDCMRAVLKREQIVVRNPHSVRPYQHVLEPVLAYLLIACKQYIDKDYASQYNVGPDDADCITTGELVGLICEAWTDMTGEAAGWNTQSDGGPHEANFLKLDCSRIKRTLGWKPAWTAAQAVRKTAEWTKAYRDREDIAGCMERQIDEYLQEFSNICRS